jgi:dTDP-4-dehydrorhamnose 3,5-epimerase
MRFIETALAGAYVIELEPFFDDRGFFSRSWCRNEFEAHGLNTRLVQCNIAYSKKRGILRGMHYQIPPHAECKLVRCTTGRVYDVLLDLRVDSPTRYHWLGFELTAANRRMIYVPEGFAHGYQALEDNSEVFYQMSEYYNREAARGVRWDDPLFGIQWPISNPILSEQDRNFPLISET